MENLDKNHARPALVFLRLIRNAGSTLGSILRRQYGVSSVLEFDSLRDVQKKLTLFEYQPGNEGENIEVFMGSFNFGQLSELPVPGHYLTMLRHPIDRIVSEYEAILNRPEHEMHHRVISNQMSLMAFVRSGISAVIDNYQTRCLCGVRNIGYGRYSADAIAIAKENLGKNFLYGITEQLDVSAIYFKHVLDWRMPYYYAEHSLKTSVEKEKLTSFDLDFLSEFSRMDLELFDFAHANFNRKIADLGDSFEAELQIFRLMNRNCNTYLRNFEDEDTFDRAEILLAADTVLNLISESALSPADLVLQHTLNRFPEAPDLHNLRAVLKYRQGNLQEAEEMLKEFAERWPSHPGAHLHLGNILSEVGEKDRSFRSYLQALKIDPTQKRTILTLGRALTQSQRLNDARSIYSFYLKNNPRDEEVKCLLENLTTERSI